MSVEVVLDSPLAHALNASIQPKLVEVGWSTGGADDSALSEYIILMLVNGKTQEQIAAELSGDLLNLGDDDPGARDFSQWLFDQVGSLNSQVSGGGFQDTGAETGQAQFGDSNVSQDADMNDAAQSGDINVYVIIFSTLLKSEIVSRDPKTNKLQTDRSQINAKWKWWY